MIEALKKTAGALLKAPHLLIPGMAVALASALLFDFLFLLGFDVFYEFGIENKAISLEFFKMIAIFFRLYPAQILVFIASILVLLALMAMLLFFYSKSAMHYGEKGAFSRSLKYMLSSARKAFGLAVFWLMFAFLVFLLLFSVVLLLPLDIFVLAALVSIIAALSALMALKLSLFAVPAIVQGDRDVRAGLSASWEFTSKRLLGTIIVFAIVFFANSVIAQLGMAAVSLFDNGIVPSTLAAFFNSLAFAFGSLFFAFYYFDNHGAVPGKKRRKKRKGK